MMEDAAMEGNVVEGALARELAAGAGALLERVDVLAGRVLEVAGREPGVFPALSPDLMAAAIAVARSDLEHELRCLADGATLPVDCPDEVRATARRTVALGAPLAIPLQCYRAGHRVLWEAWRERGPDVAGRHRGLILDAGDAFFFDYADRCCALLTVAHAEERAAARDGLARRRLSLVRRVLAAGAAPTHVGDYPLAGDHVAFVASGPEAAATVRAVVSASGLAALVLALEDETVWGWVHGPARIVARLIAEPSREAAVGVGESGNGPEGFARSHRQAQQALRVARAHARSVAGYADIALDALCTADPALSRDFADHVLGPMRDAPTLRRTLQAWLAEGQRTPPAAARLGISARTVTNHLRAIEQRLGVTDLGKRATALDVALRAEADDVP